MRNIVTKYQDIALGTSNTIDQFTLAFDAVIKLINNAMNDTTNNKFAAFDKAFMILNLLKRSVEMDDIQHDKDAVQLYEKLNDFLAAAINMVLELNIPDGNNKANAEALINTIKTVRNSIREKAKSQGLI